MGLIHTHCWNHWSLRLNPPRPANNTGRSKGEKRRSDHPGQIHHISIKQTWPISVFQLHHRVGSFIIQLRGLLALDGRCQSVIEMFMFDWFKEPLSRLLIKHSCVAAVVVRVCPPPCLWWPLHVFFSDLSTRLTCYLLTSEREKYL